MKFAISVLCKLSIFTQFDGTRIAQRLLVLPEIFKTLHQKISDFLRYVCAVIHLDQAVFVGVIEKCDAVARCRRLLARWHGDTVEITL